MKLCKPAHIKLELVQLLKVWIACGRLVDWSINLAKVRSMRIGPYKVLTQAYSDHPKCAHVCQVRERFSQGELLLALLNLGTPSSQSAPSHTPSSFTCR